MYNCTPSHPIPHLQMFYVLVDVYVRYGDRVDILYDVPHGMLHKIHGMLNRVVAMVTKSCYGDQKFP